MQIRLTFRDATGALVRWGPSCTWLSGTVLLDLLALEPREGGEVPLERLEAALTRAREALTRSDVARPAFARTEAERASFAQLLALLAEAAHEAASAGAARFLWHEDF